MNTGKERHSPGLRSLKWKAVYDQRLYRAKEFFTLLPFVFSVDSEEWNGTIECTVTINNTYSVISLSIFCCFNSFLVRVFTCGSSLLRVTNINFMHSFYAIKPTFSSRAPIVATSPFEIACFYCPVWLFKPSHFLSLFVHRIIFQLSLELIGLFLSFGCLFFVLGHLEFTTENMAF